MLGALLECVLFQTGLSLHETLLDLFKFLAFFGDFTEQTSVIRLQLFVVVALFRVKIVQLGFSCIADLLNLLLITIYVVLNFPLLCEQLVQCHSLFIILILNVHEEGLDVVGFSVRTVLVERQVVVGQFSLIASDILDERLVFALQAEVGRVVLVDVFDFLLHFGDLGHDLTVLVFQKIEEVRAIVNLATWALVSSRDADHAVVGDRAEVGLDFGSLSDSAIVHFTHGGCHPGGSAHSLGRADSSHLVRHIQAPFEI